MLKLGRDKIASTLREVADVVQLIETVKAIQLAQKEMAETIKTLGERMRSLESELRAIKAETVLECMKETQSIVNAVQGGLNQRIESIAVKTALLESQNGVHVPKIDSGHHTIARRLGTPEGG